MNKIIISVCGAAKGEPGPAVVGVSITGEVLTAPHAFAETIGNATSNYAAFFAVVRGLQAAAELFGEETVDMMVELRLSDRTVAEQLCIKHEIRDVSLVGHFIEIHNLRVSNFPNLTFLHVKRGNNKEAERLVSEILDA